LGFEPYLLSPLSPSINVKIKITKLPRYGTNTIKYHHPLFPVSCNLLTVKAIVGIKCANRKTMTRITVKYTPGPVSIPVSSLKDKTENIIVINAINKTVKIRVYIQYSFLLALPLKLA